MVGRLPTEPQLGKSGCELIIRDYMQNARFVTQEIISTVIELYIFVLF